MCCFYICFSSREWPFVMQRWLHIRAACAWEPLCWAALLQHTGISPCLLQGDICYFAYSIITTAAVQSFAKKVKHWSRGQVALSDTRMQLVPKYLS